MTVKEMREYLENLSDDDLIILYELLIKQLNKSDIEHQAPSLWYINWELEK